VTRYYEFAYNVRAFTLLEGGGVRSARLAMLLGFGYLKLQCFV